jgi:hypothetical protein
MRIIIPEEIVQDRNLTIDQKYIWGYIYMQNNYGKEPYVLNIDAISWATGIKKPTIYRIIALLVREGFMEKEVKYNAIYNQGGLKKETCTSLMAIIKIDHSAPF